MDRQAVRTTRDAKETLQLNASTHSTRKPSDQILTVSGPALRNEALEFRGGIVTPGRPIAARSQLRSTTAGWKLAKVDLVVHPPPYRAWVGRSHVPDLFTEPNGIHGRSRRSDPVRSVAARRRCFRTHKKNIQLACVDQWFKCSNVRRCRRRRCR